MQEKNRDLVLCGLSDVGRKRENNEDSFLYAEIEVKNGTPAYLLAVADGMGGHLGGEVASRIVVDILKGYVTSNQVEDDNIPRLLKGAIMEANRSIYYMSLEVSELRGMGSTCTAMLSTEGRAYVAHVGDSRAYLFRRNGVRRLTRDHTVLEHMVESGIITPDEAKRHHERSALLRAVGVTSEVEVDLTPPIDMFTGDIFVLCSDGLTEFVKDEEIGGIVNLYTPERACHELVNMANERGGTDNITVQVVRVLGNSKRASHIISGIRNLFR
jgi:protein phosphatase